MRGASGLMQRFRTSIKPPAPTRSSEWRFSWGKDLLSKGGRWCFGHRGIFFVLLSSLEYLLWQFCFCFLQRCNSPLCDFLRYLLHWHIFSSSSQISCSLISLPPFLSLVSHPPSRGPGDIIGDCKVQFLDEIYQVEKPGARALSAADGQFKRMPKLIDSQRKSWPKVYVQIKSSCVNKCFLFILGSREERAGV